MREDLNIILLGAPGSGKGTMAEVLVKKLGLLHLSTGNMFRQEINRKTALGIKIAETVKNGKLVSDDMTLEIVINTIRQIGRGLLFDGFPRTLTQAEGLDRFFKENDRKITAVIFLNLTDEEVLKRLSLRRICRNCKAVYNLVSKLPSKEGICDKCGGELILRSDDKPETVKKRLAVFKEQTAPLVDYYRSNHRFFEIDGIGSPKTVSERVLKTVGMCS